MQELEQAIALRRAGRLEESRNLLLGLVERSPGDPQVLYQTAWTHDAMGLEQEAVPFYRRAIEAGLRGEDLAAAMTGLGSTYRCLGRYSEAASLLESAREMFPENRAIEVFLAMACHNLGDHGRCAEILLRQLAETSSDPEIQAYRRALLAYAPCLDQVW